MTNATQTENTVGGALRHDPEVRQAIRTIVDRVRSHASSLTDVRGPVEALRESYESHLKRAGEVRGRGLLYPYIGSGVGNGALVELLDGSVKWDMICGIGVHFFGHSDPEQVEASVEASFGDTVKNGNLQTDDTPFEFAETLLREAGRQSNLKYCFPTAGGALANENAIKICYQKHAPASRVIAFQDCFMGRTVTMCQIGDSAAARVGVPLSTQIDYMPFYDAVEAERVGVAAHIDEHVRLLETYFKRYPSQHAAFIFELIQGEGGFNTAPTEYFRALMECCKAHGVAVWDDEIQTFGRTTSMFAYETMGVGEFVDILTVGKMTQACATLYTEQYNPKPGLLSATFTDASVAFAVGNRMLERLRDGDYYGDGGRIAAHHKAFREQVEALAARRPEWFPANDQVPSVTGGIGGMMRFTPFGGDKAKVTKACRTIFDEGVVLFYCGHDPYHIRMLPPLGVMKIEDWPRVFECIERGMAKV